MNRNICHGHAGYNKWVGEHPHLVLPLQFKGGRLLKTSTSLAFILAGSLLGSLAQQKGSAILMNHGQAAWSSAAYTTFPSPAIPDLVPRLVDAPSIVSPQSPTAALPDAALNEAIDAVYHAKGSRGDTMSLEDVKAWLRRPQGHGALFEQQVANQIQQSGRNVAFTKAGNVGTDLRVFPGNGMPMTFVQVKATADAVNSAQEALLDGLAFAGKQSNRTRELLAGRVAFEGYIPSDQFAQLMREGWLNADGSPTGKLLERILESAAKDASGAGETATRLRAVLKDSEQLLGRMKVRPGPVAYHELRQATQAAVRALQAAINRVGAAAAARPVKEVVHLLSPAWTVAGKTLRFVPLIVTPIQAWQGISDLKEGRIVEGTANLAGSGFSAGAEVAILSGKVVLSGGLMTATAFIDGGADLYRGITRTNTGRVVIGGVKCAAATVMTAGLATGQPVIVVAGTVVYVGVVVADTVAAVREAENQAVITADQSYFSRTGPLTLPPDQYKGIGLSPAEEQAIGASR